MGCRETSVATIEFDLADSFLSTRRCRYLAASGIMPDAGLASACNPAVVTVRIDGSIEGINWAQAKADLAADSFDNGRTPEALGRSFRQSHTRRLRPRRRSRRGYGSPPLGRRMQRVSTRRLTASTYRRRFTSRSVSARSQSSGRSSSARGSTTTLTGNHRTPLARPGGGSGWTMRRIGRVLDL